MTTTTFCKRTRLQSAFVRTSLFFGLLLFPAIHQLQAQNVLDKIGLTSATPSSAAYSVRRLSTGYTGSAIQVRRSSDNTLMNIGFTTAGHLDTASLKTFAGSGSAAVVKWYDQSGNGRDLTQATASHQPVIVSNGVVSRENRRPAIRFTGVNSSSNYQSLALAASMTTVGHVAAVHQMASGSYGFLLSHTTYFYWHSDPTLGWLFGTSNVSASISSGPGWRNGVATVPTQMPWPVTLTLTEVSPSNAATNIMWDNIGSDRNLYHNTTNGAYCELILFSTAPASGARTTMETNQLAYFLAAGALPVSWLSFTAEAQQQGVLLKWQTATEQHTKSFVIQHSTNGNTWSDIATMAAAGNSTVVQSYRYVHEGALQGKHYYRILQTDLDGEASYSAVKTATIAGDKEAVLTVRENPVSNGQITVQLSKAMTLYLYDMNGKQLFSKQYNAGTYVISVSGYTKGVYLLKGAGVTQRILIQ